MGDKTKMSDKNLSSCQKKMDDGFAEFLYHTEKLFFPVTTFTTDFLVDNERNIRDAMYIASQAIKYGFIEVRKKEYDDGSWTREFTINSSHTRIREEVDE